MTDYNSVFHISSAYVLGQLLSVFLLSKVCSLTCITSPVFHCHYCSCYDTWISPWDKLGHIFELLNKWTKNLKMMSETLLVQKCCFTLNYEPLYYSYGTEGPYVEAHISNGHGDTAVIL